MERSQWGTRPRQYPGPSATHYRQALAIFRRIGERYGEVCALNRTLLDEWAYAQPYRSGAERRDAYPAWLHTYNHHRGHTALAGKPPASRVPDLTGQYP